MTMIASLPPPSPIPINSIIFHDEAIPFPGKLVCRLLYVGFIVTMTNVGGKLFTTGAFDEHPNDDAFPLLVRSGLILILLKIRGIYYFLTKESTQLELEITKNRVSFRLQAGRETS